MGRKGAEAGQCDPSRGRSTGSGSEEKLDEAGEGFSKLSECVVRQSGLALGRVAWGCDGEPRQGSELYEGGENARGEITWLEDGEGEPVHGPMKALDDEEFKNGHDFLRLKDGP